MNHCSEFCYILNLCEGNSRITVERFFYILSAFHTKDFVSCRPRHLEGGGPCLVVIIYFQEKLQMNVLFSCSALSRLPCRLLLLVNLFQSLICSYGDVSLAIGMTSAQNLPLLQSSLILNQINQK